MEVFPGDSWDIDLMLTQLNDLNLIQRYQVKEGQKYIQIPKFAEHQRPHHQEKQSVIPGPDKARTTSRQGANQSALIPDTRILIPEDIGHVTVTDRFPDFWKTYPKKRKKKNAQEIWRRKKLDAKADVLIADVQNRLQNDKQWRDGFIPDPTTYLNGERWDDELESLVTVAPVKHRKPETLTEEQRQRDREQAERDLARLKELSGG